MELLRIGASRYTVLVSEQVLAELSDWGSAKEQKTAMLSLLTQSVPQYGPQEDNPKICKPLKGTDGLFEFRKNAHRGPKLRVLWFYGDVSKSVVVCARAFVKTFEHLPPDEMSATVEARSSYAEALHGHRLRIEDGSHLVRRK